MFNVKAGEVDEDGEEVEMVLGDAEGGADASISYVTEGEDSQDEGVAMNDTEGEVAAAVSLLLRLFFNIFEKYQAQKTQRPK